MTITRKYGYLWVTLVLFVISAAGHWISAWVVYVQEHMTAGLPVDGAEYAVTTLRDTLENWQSEFLQLIWQVAGLSFLLHVGSPQSKEESERTEEKIDALLKAVGGKKAEKIISDLERKYPKS